MKRTILAVVVTAVVAPMAHASNVDVINFARQAENIANQEFAMNRFSSMQTQDNRDRLVAMRTEAHNAFDNLNARDRMVVTGLADKLFRAGLGADTTGEIRRIADSDFHPANVPEGWDQSKTQAFIDAAHGITRPNSAPALPTHTTQADRDAFAALQRNAAAQQYVDNLEQAKIAYSQQQDKTSPASAALRDVMTSLQQKINQIYTLPAQQTPAVVEKTAAPVTLVGGEGDSRPVEPVSTSKAVPVATVVQSKPLIETTAVDEPESTISVKPVDLSGIELHAVDEPEPTITTKPAVILVDTPVKAVEKQAADNKLIGGDDSRPATPVDESKAVPVAVPVVNAPLHETNTQQAASVVVGGADDAKAAEPESTAKAEPVAIPVESKPLIEAQQSVAVVKGSADDAKAAEPTSTAKADTVAPVVTSKPLTETIPASTLTPAKKPVETAAQDKPAVIKNDPAQVVNNYTISGMTAKQAAQQQDNTDQILSHSRAISSNREAIQQNSQKIDRLQSQQDTDRKAAKAGTANALAVSGLHYVDTDNSIAIGAGTYEGQNAGSIGYRHKFSENVAATIAASQDSNGGTGAAASLAVGW